MAQKAYKLLYFPFRGRGEFIRLAFIIAGVEYEDCRIDNETWATLKAGELLPTSCKYGINYGVIDQACSPDSWVLAKCFFLRETIVEVLECAKNRNEANIQPSLPNKLANHRAVAGNRPTEARASVISFAFVVYSHHKHS